MSLDVFSEANRCLQCKVARCHQSCPIHTEIPQMIRYYKENKLDEAGEMLYSNNPFSMVCSYVCNHEAQCVGNCILNFKKIPIQVNQIEQRIGNHYLPKIGELYNRPLKTRKKVAIIGAGPSGISAALLLRKQGIGSDIYEEREEIGGVCRYGIPDFRLPHEILDAYKKALEQCEVGIYCNHEVKDIEKFNALKEKYDAVVITVGAWKQKNLNISGELNCVSGVDYLVDPLRYHTKGRVIVLGAGNSAVDVARVAKHQGAHSVSMYARTNRVRASHSEVEEAKQEGVEIFCGYAPLEVDDLGQKIKFEKKTYDEKNEWIETEPTTYPEAEADLIIVSINRGLDFIQGLLELDQWGNILTDDQGQTSLMDVYSAGDAALGSKTVVHAVENVKKVVKTLSQDWIVD